MAEAIQANPASWHASNSPMALSEIFSADTSVAIWQRQPKPVINRYFDQVFNQLGMGVRQVFSLSSVREELLNLLPDGEGKPEVVADIYLLCDMLTCLFNCDSVGLRLVPLDKAMCPKLHTDNIPVRLVNTYLGPGSQWLPNESSHIQAPASARSNIKKTAAGLYYNPDDIQQMRSFDVGLLKGSAWEGHENMAALHRSCQVPQGEKRVLLTLDPM